MSDYSWRRAVLRQVEAVEGEVLEMRRQHFHLIAAVEITMTALLIGAPYVMATAWMILL